MGLLVVVCVVPVWSTSYFLTTDGPTHVYNARVLLDLATGSDGDFYRQYYEVNPRPEPNWFGHVALAGLLTFLSGAVAEKVFVTAYVAVFAIALWRLLRAIRPGSEFLAIVGLPLAFHRSLHLGFYNFSLSVAFLFLVLERWWTWKRELTRERVLILTFLFLIIYTTHPVGFVYAGVALIEEVVGWSRRTRNPKLRAETRGQTLKLLAALLPTLLLFAEFLWDKRAKPVPRHAGPQTLLENLIDLRALVSMTSEEIVWAKALAFLLFGLGVVALVARVRARALAPVDGLAFATVASCALYFLAPGGLAGGGILTPRLAILTYVLGLLWVAGAPFGNVVRPIAVVAGVVISVSLVAIKLPWHARAAEACEELLSVAPAIEPRSTVLPLSFDHHGRTPEGEPVVENIWLFKHAADYVGTDRPLVMLGNYEGHTGFFPLVWRAERNPFDHLGGDAGIEAQPPEARIQEYVERTGASVDYVLTWALEDDDREHERTRALLDELELYYRPIATSPHGLASLYERADRLD